MNLNLNFKQLNPQMLLALLKQFGPTVVSLALLGVFGYTGWAVNAAFHVKPADPGASADTKISFDKKTIETVKNLHVVDGHVAPADLGKTDPFGNN